MSSLRDDAREFRRLRGELAGRHRCRACRARPIPSPDFALSESPRYVGRAIVALASDPDRARWNEKSVSSGQLAREYGFIDLDGSRPDIWRYIEEVRERGLRARLDEYR